MTLGKLLAGVVLLGILALGIRALLSDEQKAAPTGPAHDGETAPKERIADDEESNHLVFDRQYGLEIGEEALLVPRGALQPDGTGVFEVANLYGMTPWDIFRAFAAVAEYQTEASSASAAMTVATEDIAGGSPEWELNHAQHRFDLRFGPLLEDGTFDVVTTYPNMLVQYVGIKGIDLLCPFVKGGKIGLFGGAGVGKTVLIQELISRIAVASGAPTVFEGEVSMSELATLVAALESAAGIEPGAEPGSWNVADGVLTSIELAEGEAPVIQQSAGEFGIRVADYHKKLATMEGTATVSGGAATVDFMFKPPSKK